MSCGQVGVADFAVLQPDREPVPADPPQGAGGLVAGQQHQRSLGGGVVEDSLQGGEVCYWRPFFYLLEARGLECRLVNARDVKNVPGRPKTGKLDAVWLAKPADAAWPALRPSLRSRSGN